MARLCFVPDDNESSGGAPGVVEGAIESGIEIDVCPIHEAGQPDGCDGQGLTSFLVQRPDLAVTERLPCNPVMLPDSGEMFAKKAKYLNFGSGTGVRYVGLFSQTSYPVVLDGDPIYVFDGVTSDQQYIVSARVRVFTGGILPHAYTSLGPGWESNYPNYQRTIETRLDVLADSRYMPNLKLLDEMIQSLTVVPQ